MPLVSYPFLSSAWWSNGDFGHQCWDEVIFFFVNVKLFLIVTFSVDEAEEEIEEDEEEEEGDVEEAEQEEPE